MSDEVVVDSLDSVSTESTDDTEIEERLDEWMKGRSQLKDGRDRIEGKTWAISWG